VKVVVTGSAGFIGRPTVVALERAGHEVRGFDRAGDPADTIVDRSRLSARMGGCEAVVHLAAKVGLGVGVDDLDDYAWHNDYGTAVVLRAAAAQRVPRIVFASSMVVYGEGAYACPRHGPVRAPARTVPDLAQGRFDPRCLTCGSPLVPGLVREDAPLDPRNTYAATKVHGEHLLASWARETGGLGVALRFHNVYGPGMPRDTPYAGVAALFASALARGQPPRVFEDGRQRRNFVHVRDVAAAVAAATDTELPAGVTALNIGSPSVTTVGAVARALSTALSGPEPVVTGEYRLGDVRHITADCRAAEQVLGWRAAMDLAQGMATSFPRA